MRKRGFSEWLRIRTCAVRPIDRDRGHFRRARDAFAWSPRSRRASVRRAAASTPRCLALGQHGAQVLDRAVDVEGHRTAVAALEHRRDARAAHLEHVRAAGRIGEEVHDPRGIEAERTAERKRFAERLPIDHQRHVDGELHDRAGADRAAMLEPPAELVEDRLRARGVGRRGAHQADQLALPRRTGRTAHRTFDAAPRPSRAPVRPAPLRSAAAPCSSR